MQYGLSLQQTQKLIMTPQLRQAITILQLGALELSQYILEQIYENPLLELGDDPAHSNHERDIEELMSEPEWLQYFDDSSDLGYVASYSDAPPPYESVISQSPTLQEHLLFQVHLLSLTPEELRIAEYFIGNLDRFGYLKVGVPDVCRDLGVSESTAEKVLMMLQSLDPPGVCARDLQECLLIQAAIRGEGPLVMRIIREHLEDLGMGKYCRIGEKLGVAATEVQKAADRIKTLNPRPGNGFGGGQDTRYIIPDVTVHRVDGEYVVQVNDSAVPRLGISRTYRKILSERGEEETRKFVEAKLSSALWVLRSIEQRRMTLYKVVESIVKIQRDFFDRGIRHLKPMTLRDVAALIGMHESTISRATANKYVQTPHGVFELRFFFSSGVESQKGKLSALSVKKHIREMIMREDPKDPLSDQRIAEILASRGIYISRRTVAKYRADAGILPSCQRKRY